MKYNMISNYENKLIIHTCVMLINTNIYYLSTLTEVHWVIFINIKIK